MTAENSKNKALRQKLLKWYDKNQRDLPWRDNQDPWKVWVSEIMLQQTTVDTVIPFYTRFIKRFPDPSSLARAREETALKLWEGLGYYHRIRNLRKAAALVAKEGFPESPEGWKALPGLGPYASAAIASIVNAKVISVVDGNVYRILSRLKKDNKAIDGSKAYEHFEKIADTLISKKRPGDFNQAMMELGATVCRPRKPLCLLCPWQSDCKGQNIWQSLPVKNKKTKITSLAVAVALIKRKDGCYLLDLRSAKTVMGGLWEFPGGKIEEGESPEQALKREILEEVGLKIRILEALPLTQHAYTRYRVKLFPFLCEKISGRARPIDEAIEKVRWVAPKDFKKLSMPAGSRKIIKLLPKNLKF
jgi:A/G-specific adenine glycosylase